MSKKLGQIEVVGALIRDHESILIARRGSGAHKNMWEFPGGKVDDGESHKQALKREIKEELNVEVEVYELVKSVSFEIDGYSYILHGYLAELRYGEINLDFHSEFAWVPIDQIMQYELAPADIPIAEEIMNYVR